MKYDPELKNVQKEALATMAKATEFFIAYATECSVRSAALRGAKTVRSSDFVRAVQTEEALQFLKDDFPASFITKGKRKASTDESGVSSKEKRSAEDTNDSNASKRSRLVANVAAAVSNGQSSLLTFFGKDHSRAVAVEDTN